MLLSSQLRNQLQSVPLSSQFESKNKRANKKIQNNFALSYM